MPIDHQSGPGRQIVLCIAYTGTFYAGWQRQSNAITVQGTLEQALSQLLQEPVRVTGCSRTDAGVHARRHYSHFFTRSTLPADRLPYAISPFLPKDIVVLKAWDADGSFHARMQAQSKIYSYLIWNSSRPDPFWQQRSAFVPGLLDLSLMQQAARDLVGVHEFDSFCAAGSTAKTTSREILACSVDCPPTAHDLPPGFENAGLAADYGRLLRFVVHGSGFLYNMVRIMAGTLLYIGSGKLAPDSIPAIIAAKDRKRAGKTMPPQGLTLEYVRYADSRYADLALSGPQKELNNEL
ncbi:tRNA pseudouridine(38-40) synthase TruA [Oscillospiraceae bacterium HV4-5-C5C]|nr:tRNA pseudouridine(38-40) synthase TruA [Oscillospiraceae bacterium HV4-5-C5C]